MKTVDLRERKGGRIGDRKGTLSFQGVSQEGTKERSNSLRRGGVAGGFLRLGEVTHVCVWTGMIQESGSTDDPKERLSGEGCSLGAFIRNAKILDSGVGSRRFDSEKRGLAETSGISFPWTLPVSLGLNFLNLNISLF